MLENIKAINFDFDGVLSLNADGKHKPDAYAVVLGRYSERYKLALQEARSLYGYGKAGGRREILQHTLHVLGEAPESINSLAEIASQEFDNYVQSKILEDGLVPGALQVLEELSMHGIPLYLNSGTATSALLLSAKNLRIDRFFKGILGSTNSKVENIHFIANEEGITDFSSILVVGDGDSDVSAAQQLGCPFIGIANVWNGWVDKEQPFTVVTHLEKIPDLLELST
jgi:phosphoglycolate phosphatase-like HAD superfamily hydrolase